MHIIRLNLYYEDTTAFLLKNRQLILVTEEERYTKKKHLTDLQTRALESNVIEE